MVSLRSLRLLGFALPLREPLATAYGLLTLRRGCVVVVEDEQGRCGLGELSPHPAAPVGALAAAQRAVGEASSWLVGAALDQMPALLERARTLPSAAAAALDVALLDLLGHASGRSVAELLGGARRSTIVASATLTGEPAAAARAAADAGFRTAKLKGGTDPLAALAAVAAVHRAVPDLALRLDVNGAWSAAAALAAVAGLDAEGLDWLEQPVPADDVASLARVRRAAAARVAADEAVTGPEAVHRLAAADAADVVVLKLVQVGGLGAAVATAQAARRHGIGCTVTTGLDAGIATAAALHLAAVLPGVEPCGVATAALLAGDLVLGVSPPAPVMAVPAGPGLGVTLDPAALGRWRTEVVA